MSQSDEKGRHTTQGMMIMMSEIRKVDGKKLERQKASNGSSSGGDVQRNNNYCSVDSAIKNKKQRDSSAFSVSQRRDCEL
jgi:hypothetical protein